MKFILVGMPLLALLLAISCSAIYHATSVYPMELPTPNNSIYLQQCKIRDHLHEMTLPS